LIYLYLAGRDRTNMDLLTLFRGDCRPRRVDSLSELGLPPEWEGALTPFVAARRMEMEVWVEGAAGVPELQAQLRARGYTGLPMVVRPRVWLSAVPRPGDPATGLVRGTYPVDLDPDLLRRWAVAARRLKSGSGHVVPDPVF